MTDHPVTDKRNLGLYPKFQVHRTDGTDGSGEKHDGCEYFVLDVTHDKFAPEALLAYSKACASEYPALSHDLRMLANGQILGRIPGIFPGDPRGEPR